MLTNRRHLFAALAFLILLFTLKAQDIMTSYAQVQDDASLMDQIKTKSRYLQNPLTPIEPFQKATQQTKENISFGTFTKQVQQEEKKQQIIKNSNEQINTEPTTHQTKQINDTKAQKADDKQNKPQGNSTQSGIQLSEVNKPILGKGFKRDIGVSYQRLHIGELEKKYLFIDLKLSEKDTWQKTNITISNQGSQKPLILCVSDDLDSCYIAKELLNKNSNLFIYIQCEDDCTYSLKGRWSDLQHLIPNKDLIFIFGQQTTQMFHVELQGEQYEEVRIHLASRTTRKPFENVKIYGKYGGNNPTQNDYDFKSINLWQGGQGIFLLKKNMKANNFNILVIGQSETSYILKYELVKEKMHQIQNNQHLYQYLQAESTKTYKVTNVSLQIFQSFSFKFSLFSGDAQINYYNDAAMTKQILVSPIEYMKDSEYIINKYNLNESKGGLYIQIKTGKRDAVYTLKYVGRMTNFPIELNQHVYSFIGMQKQQFAYFNYKDWIDATQKSRQLKFSVSVIAVEGKAITSFRICKTTLQQCSNPKFYSNFTSQLPKTSQDTIGQKRIYNFQLASSELTAINSIENQAIILVSFRPENGSKFAMVALQFINNNKVLYLRQGRPLQQQLAADQVKLYKYINSDPDVVEIRIHVNQIAGHVKLLGLIKVDSEDQPIKINPEANTLRFTQNLTSTIILSLNAEIKSIVGITMQIIHKSDNKESLNIFTIAQDLSYTVKIQPYTYVIFEVVPIYYQFIFRYSASQSIIACRLSVPTSKCVDEKGKQIIAPQLTNKGQYKTAILQDRKGRIKITNPSSSSIAEVTVIFHSRNIERCQSKKIGYMYHQLVEDKRCFQFTLQQSKNNLQIYVSKREFARISYTIFLCGNSIKAANKLKLFTINSTVIQQQCSKSLQGWKLAIEWDAGHNTTAQDSKKVQVDFLVQYAEELTILPEGVSYQANQLSKEGILRKFGFSVINKANTKIILTSNRGIFTVFAKIIKQSDKKVEQISNTKFEFESTNNIDFRQQPMIAISEKDLKQAPCTDCMILIGVYTSEAIGATVEFEIQVVQNIQSINENKAIVGYLQANSYAYYVYEMNRDTNSTLLLIISDHNERCANLYLGLIQYPGPQANIASAVEKGILTYQHVKGQQKYYITVQSTKTCEYSISAISSDTSIQNLQGGKQILLQLVKGYKQYFVFQHSNEPFKIYALSKLGEIKLYLNKSSIEINKRSFTTDELNTDKFQYRSQHTNVLSVGEKDPIYCKNCTYFLAVQAIKSTVSTLLLAYPQTLIPLAEKKYFSDYLQKQKDYSLLSYKKLQKTQLKISVHKGQIQVSVTYKQFKMSQIFTAKSEHQMMIVDVNKQGNKVKTIPSSGNKNSTIRYIERIPINIVITAKTNNCIYAIQATSLEGASLTDVSAYQDILAGQPNHVKISSDKVICLKGYYRQANEDIIISANTENSQMLNSLIVNAKINAFQAKIQKSIVKNLLTLNLTYNGSYQGASYQICLKYSEPDEDNTNLVGSNVKQMADDDETIFNAIVTQVNTVNLLTSDTESIVKGQTVLTIHNDGQFLLDVFQCENEGNTKIKWGKSIKALQTLKTKTLQLAGMQGQKHAIKISGDDSTTYVHLQSNFSVVRWLPINAQADQGTGYMKFSTGDLRYTSKFKYVSIQYQLLQPVKTTKAVVKNTQYFLIISNDSIKLDLYSQCELTNKSNIMIVPLGNMTLSVKANKDYRSYDVDKRLLQESFPTDTNIFITIVGKLTLQVKENENKSKSGWDEHEHYRFIYNRQQMPLQSYKQSQIQVIPYHFLLFIVFSVAILFLLATYLLTRKIIPMLARLKNSNLVQDKDAQPEMELAEVPPSSDRNQRENVVVETEDQMKK